MSNLTIVAVMWVCVLLGFVGGVIVGFVICGQATRRRGILCGKCQSRFDAWLYGEADDG